MISYGPRTLLAWLAALLRCSVHSIGNGRFSCCSINR